MSAVREVAALALWRPLWRPCSRRRAGTRPRTTPSSSRLPTGRPDRPTSEPGRRPRVGGRPFLRRKVARPCVSPRCRSTRSSTPSSDSGQGGGHAGPPGARGVRKEAVWQVNLVIVVAFFGLLLLMRYAGNARAAGTGVHRLPDARSRHDAAAVCDGLLRPRSLGCVGFRRVALLLYKPDSRAAGRRGRAPRRSGRRCGGAARARSGGTCGVVVDRPRLQRGGLYIAGLVVGTTPLLAYNTWAFGSPFRNGYSDAVAVLGATGHDVVGANDGGFFGLTHPRPDDALDLLFDSERGLFVLTPVVAVAVAGLVLLWRRGMRRAAIFVGSLAVAFILYNAAYWIRSAVTRPDLAFSYLCCPSSPCRSPRPSLRGSGSRW